MTTSFLNATYAVNVIMYELLQVSAGIFDTEDRVPREPANLREVRAMELAARHRQEWSALMDGDRRALASVLFAHPSTYGCGSSRPLG